MSTTGCPHQTQRKQGLTPGNEDLQELVEAGAKLFDKLSVMSQEKLQVQLKSVFRIRGILVWIQVQIGILGCVPLTNGSGSVSCSFVSDLEDANKKYLFFL
jgi:hypothetical protein